MAREGGESIQGPCEPGLMSGSSARELDPEAVLSTTLDNGDVVYHFAPVRSLSGCA